MRRTTNWNIDEVYYPGPDLESVGWANINGKQYPVYGVTVSSINIEGNNFILAAPMALTNGDTLEFTLPSISTTFSN